MSVKFFSVVSNTFLNYTNNNHFSAAYKCNQLKISSEGNNACTKTTAEDQMLQLVLSELATNFVAGFVIKKIKKKVVDCSSCKQSLFGEQHDQKMN